MRTLSILVSLIVFPAQAQTPVEFNQKPVDISTSPKPGGSNAAETLKLLFQAMVPNRKSGAPTNPGTFTVNGCTIPLQKWVAYVLGTDVTHTFVFAKGCDISGTVTLRHVPFPVDLKIRNFEDYNQVKFTSDIKIVLDLANQKANVTFKGTDGQLLSPSSPATEFSGDYATAIGLDGRIVDNSGGTLRITKLRGKSENSVTKLQF